jgi:hypothetical protein
MVLTAGQTTAFFESADQMAIPNATVLQLVAEGIDSVDDLAEFDKDTIYQIASNLRRPPAGAHYVFGAKSQKRLVAAAEIVRYYETVGRPLTAANLMWNTVIKRFDIQWKALKDKKDQDEPDTPKIAKGLNIMKWSESFRDILHRCIGVRMIPLAYVIRELETPVPITILAAGEPHSALAGSIENELIIRGSHTHPLYRDDNAAVYYKLEEATRSTSYAASIKPYQKAKNGRAAMTAIVSQYAGADKWESEIKTKEALLHGTKWKGQSNFTLERHAAQHRNAYVSLVACAEHVDYQLPNEHSRVGYLLDSIQNNDPGLQAAMANVRTSQGVTGMRSNFEPMIAHILPYCPVAKKKIAGTKRGNGEISAIEGDKTEGNVSSFGTKTGRGPKTGVHLRYHKHSEYQKLSADEQTELREWRSTQVGGKKGGSNKDRPTKKVHYDEKSIAAVVDKKIEAKMKAAADTHSKEVEAEAFVVSCLQKLANGGLVLPTPKKTNVAATTSSAKAASSQLLNSILGRAKNPTTEG